MAPASTPSRTPHWPAGLPQTIHVPATSLVYNVEHAARRYPGKTAIQYFGTAITYARLLEDVDRLAGYLQRDCGVKPGDRVLLCAQNCPQYIIASYAILRAEAVVVPANPMWLTGEIEHVADDSGARVAIVAEDLYAQMAPLHGHAIARVLTFAYADALDDDGGLPVPGWVRERMDLPVTDMAGPASTWAAAMAAGRVPAPHQAGPDTLALLAYTSGTTGRPKGCMHTHRSLMCAAAGSQVWRANGPESVFLAVAPMFHMLGLQNGMHAPLYLGATIVLMPRWDAALAAALIERFRVSNWNAPPAMLVDFFAQPGIDERDLSSLSFLGGGGAAMPEAVATTLQTRFGLPYVEASPPCPTDCRLPSPERRSRAQDSACRRRCRSSSAWAASIPARAPRWPPASPQGSRRRWWHWPAPARWRTRCAARQASICSAMSPTCPAFWPWPMPSSWPRSTRARRSPCWRPRAPGRRSSRPRPHWRLGPRRRRWRA